MFHQQMSSHQMQLAGTLGIILCGDTYICDIKLRKAATGIINLD